ncbi:hypothetical protein HanXRQr2_Chr17g0799791 [Helianthus annuus]|uniref:Uncharacterized protein n=1 Tax=Helianthus annuus TaxID=4232 RepID=A0A9K3DJ62_HELAN|nr:hypothetical protein HanXRQr2_Chr17g0799791 [Helianthus annuus]KAJ0812913.1 hypothetical protein HanPSC8_Chr17g0767381 [Helianthus annuus]
MQLLHFISRFQQGKATKTRGWYGRSIRRWGYPEDRFEHTPCAQLQLEMIHLVPCFVKRKCM